MSAPIAAIAAGTAAVFYLLRRRPSAQPQVPGAPPPGMTWEDWQAYDDRKVRGASAWAADADADASAHVVTCSVAMLALSFRACCLNNCAAAFCSMLSWLQHEGAWLGYKAIPSAVTEEERRIIASGGQISSEKTAAGTVHTSMS